MEHWTSFLIGLVEGQPGPRWAPKSEEVSSALPIDHFRYIKEVGSGEEHLISTDVLVVEAVVMFGYMTLLGPTIGVDPEDEAMSGFEAAGRLRVAMQILSTRTPVHPLLESLGQALGRVVTDGEPWVKERVDYLVEHLAFTPALKHIFADWWDDPVKKKCLEEAYVKDWRVDTPSTIS